MAPSARSQALGADPLSRLEPEPQPADVNANHGVAAGRDIRDFTITFGLDEEGIRRVFQEEVVRIAGEKGIPVAPLRAVLAKLGEAGIPDHEIPAHLDAAANELIDLRAQLTRLTNDRPEFAAIREQALALIDRGELDAARAALGRGRSAARTLRENVSRNEAEFLADEARIDHLQLAYRSAAGRYAEAACLVASFDTEWRKNWLIAQAGEFYDQGREFGDNAALADAVGLYNQCLDLALRTRIPVKWAAMQNNLGNALATLGERESGTARLEEAVAAYHAALEELTHERVPLDWATTQMNLGAALSKLGERESGTARLEEAVAAYRAALEEWTPEAAPYWHDIAQQNLVRCLAVLEQRRKP